MQGPRLVGAVLALNFSVLATIVVLAGCGGGENGDPVTISRAEFIERADAICSQTKNRIEAEFSAYAESEAAKEAERARQAGVSTFNDAAAHVAETILIPAMRRQLQELRAIGIPSDETGEAQALLDAFSEGIEKAEARPERAARDSTEAFGESRRLAGEYGIDSC